MPAFLRRSPFFYLAVALVVAVAAFAGFDFVRNRVEDELFVNQQRVRRRVEIAVTPQRDEKGNYTFRADAPPGFDPQRYDADVKVNPPVSAPGSP
jgi:hypothetical protein